jgi:release factor glutamine methyltransferase
MRIADALALGTARLPHRRGLPEPAREAAWLLARAAGLSEARVHTDPGLELDEAVLERYQGWIERRAAGSPAHHLTGTCPFWGVELEVGPAVLVPRPETELLVQAVLDLPLPAGLPADAGADPATAAPRALDVGTGSGCILIALGRERPGWRLAGVDRSAAALAVARRNLRAAGVPALLWQGDLVAAARKRFDLVVANLPYIPSADLAGLPVEVRHDPALALDGGPDGLDLVRRLLGSLDQVLVGQGLAVLELGDDQADAVAQVAAAEGLEVIQRVRDLGGFERVVVLRRHASGSSSQGRL